MMLFFRYFLEIVSFFLVILFLVVGEFCSYMKVEKKLLFLKKIEVSLNG